MLENAVAGILASPGTGKTSAVLAVFKMLSKRGLVKRMLVVAPLKPVHLVWSQEVAKWVDFADLRVEVLHGPKKDEALRRDADVYVINYEGLDWLLGATRTTSPSGKVSVTCDVAAFRKLRFDVLVIDELTACKSTASGRHKAIRAVRHTFSRIYGLTGTPVPNGLLDLFGQVLVLDGGRSFGPYITHYRTKYFIPSYDGFSWNLRKGAEAEIYERLRPLVIRLAAEDYVDMPKLVENVIRFDLPPAARAVYDRLEEDMFAKVEGRTVVASNAAAASTKLRQVANGGVYLDAEVLGALPRTFKRGAREWAALHDEKTDLLETLYEGLQGQPLLVAYEFNHDLERLLTRFGRDTPYFRPGMSGKDLAKLEAAWNAGEVPLLLGQSRAVGHGINLQGSGNHVAWYGPTWDREIFDQLNGRVARQGSKHQTVFVHMFLARDTVDEDVFWALRAKGRTQDALLAAMKERRKKYRAA